MVVSLIGTEIWSNLWTWVQVFRRQIDSLSISHNKDSNLRPIISPVTGSRKDLQYKELVSFRGIFFKENHREIYYSCSTCFLIALMDILLGQLLL